jgi:hypothetical protein
MLTSNDLCWDDGFFEEPGRPDGRCCSDAPSGVVRTTSPLGVSAPKTSELRRNSGPELGKKLWDCGGGPPPSARRAT